MPIFRASFLSPFHPQPKRQLSPFSELSFFPPFHPQPERQPCPFSELSFFPPFHPQPQRQPCPFSEFSFFPPFHPQPERQPCPSSEVSFFPPFHPQPILTLKILWLSVMGKWVFLCGSVEEREEPLEIFVFVESLSMEKCHFSRATEKWEKVCQNWQKTKISLSRGVMCPVPEPVQWQEAKQKKCRALAGAGVPAQAMSAVNGTRSSARSGVAYRLVGTTKQQSQQIQAT